MSNKKTIGIVAIAVIAAILVGFFAYNAFSDLKGQRLEREFNDEITPYVIEQTEIERQKRKMIDEYMGNAPSGANTALVFLDLRDSLYDLFAVVESEEREHLSGILAISPEQMPGDEGKITKEQLAQMLAAGWDVALFWAGPENVEDVDIALLDSYLSQMRTSLSSLGVAMTDTLIFDEMVYVDEYDEVLKKHGIVYATHYAKGNYPLIDKEIDREGNGTIMHPGIVGWNEQGYGKRFLQAVDIEKGIAAFAIEFEPGGDLGSFLDLGRQDYLDAFERMLDEIEATAEAGDVTCLAFREAYENRKGYVLASELMNDEIGEELAAMDARVAEIRRTIIAILEKYDK